MRKKEKISDRYLEALDDFYEIAEEEGVDIIVIGMDTFSLMSKRDRKLREYE
jgi:DNA repair exonuclease SbcCD nuclease subunit|tara:strand:+ start:324 stop:479 length:156 start_codon:yes stop_codon:yes gene_type:complete